MEREGVHGLVAWPLLSAAAGAAACSTKKNCAAWRGLTLSPVTPAPEAAAWVAGVLRGGAQMLMVQDGLWQALDGWLAALDGEVFVALLPLLRRAFTDFEAPARRAMGEKVKHLHAGRRRAC